MFNLPEAFYTINIIRSIDINEISIVLILGILLFFIIFIIYYIKSSSKLKFNLNNLILVIIFIFWIPVYLIIFYNNIYDLQENFVEYKNKNVLERHKIRLCNMEKVHSSNGQICQLFSYIELVNDSIPSSSLVKIISSPFIEPYLHYYLYPDYDFTYDIKNANFVLFYMSQEEYFIENSILKKKLNKKNEEIGSYKIIKSAGPGKFILKK